MTPCKRGDAGADCASQGCCPQPNIELARPACRSHSSTPSHARNEASCPLNSLAAKSRTQPSSRDGPFDLYDIYIYI